MVTEPNDDNTQDLTPYDLAERLVAGLPVTDAGKVEIARELLDIRNTLRLLRGDWSPDAALHLQRLADRIHGI